MKAYVANPASLLFPLSVTAIILAAHVAGYLLVAPTHQYLSTLSALSPYRQALGEGLFFIATTMLGALVGYWYATKTWPELSRDLGFRVPCTARSLLSILAWALLAVLVTVAFDYCTSGLTAPSSESSIGPELVHGQQPSAGAAAFIVVNVLITGLGAPFFEELTCRGIVLPVWKKYLESNPLAGLKVSDRAAKLIALTFPVIISAALFAIPHGEGLLSQFFSGWLSARSSYAAKRSGCLLSLTA